MARVGFRLINGIDRMWPMLLEAEIPHSDKRTSQDLARNGAQTSGQTISSRGRARMACPRNHLLGEVSGGRPQVASNETVSEYSNLFRFDASGFDDTRGAFTLALHEARELGLRHGHWIGPVFREPVAQFWCSQDACDVFR